MKCKIIYDTVVFGQQIHELEDTPPYKNTWAWIKANPPDPTVRKVYLMNGTTISPLNAIKDFSWERYDEAIKSKQWENEYFRRTGEKWVEPERKERQSIPSLVDKGTARDDKVTKEMALHIFGLKKDYTAAELKAAHRKALKEHHPDKVASMSPELRDRAEEKTKQINEAYSILSE